MNMNSGSDTNVRSNIWKLYVIRALSGCLVGISVIVLLFQSVGLTLQQIHLLQAGFALSVLIFEIPSGYLADRWTRKQTLILGFGIQIAGWILYAFAQDFLGFLAAEILLGIGVSFLSGTLDAITYDSLLESNEEGTFRKVTRLQLSFDLSAEAISAILGGFVALWSLHATIWLTAGAFAAGLLACCTLREPQRHKVQEVRHWKALWDVCSNTLLWHRGLRSITLIGGLISAMTLTLFWFTQPYQKAIELPLYLWGFAHAAVVLAGAFAAQKAPWLEERTDDRKILMGIAVGVFAIYMALSSFPLHWACLSLFLFSRVTWCLLGPLTTDMVNRMTTSDVRATVLSVHSFGGRLIFALSSPFVAGLADDHGIPFALYVAGVLGGGTLLIVFIRLRTVWDELPR